MKWTFVTRAELDALRSLQAAVNAGEFVRPQPTPPPVPARDIVVRVVMPATLSVQLTPPPAPVKPVREAAAPEVELPEEIEKTCQAMSFPGQPNAKRELAYNRMEARKCLADGMTHDATIEHIRRGPKRNAWAKIAGRVPTPPVDDRFLEILSDVNQPDTAAKFEAHVGTLLDNAVRD